MEFRGVLFRSGADREAGEARPRPHDGQRRGPGGGVGQGIQGRSDFGARARRSRERAPATASRRASGRATMAAGATTAVPVEDRGGSRLSAASLIGPATFIVAAGLLIPIAILFRYSLDQYEARRFVVEGYTLENYVTFFSDAYYLGVFFTTIKVALICPLVRSEEHTSELQSLMRISYAVFCLK